MEPEARPSASWAIMRFMFSELRWENVRITLSGGTTGWSLINKDSRVDGARTFCWRDWVGDIMRDSEERYQSHVECGWRVMACRKEGIVDQDCGVLSMRS